ncbi:MAG: putative DNA binding domain-containing protein [Oscillospiraceae bacterium]|nr:putative DNA binding domain-containing protein [Oscillospiraceae bacterium]
MSIRMESETLEFKSEIVSDLCKEVVAFANTRGGELWIGVADDGTAIGISEPDEALLRINNMVRDSIKPDVTMFARYEIRMLDGKEIIAVTVQKGADRPYYLAAKGLKPSGVYVRNGASTDPSTDTAIRRMIKETDGDRFEDMRSLEQELTFAAAEAEFQKRDVDFGPVQRQTLGLISPDGVYSNLGYLLSDQCPGEIKAATFSGLDKTVFQDRREFSGSLFRQMEELYAYLELRNQTKAVFEGLYRKDIRDYPEEALREAMLNSIVHRDYSYSASTLVSVYADRIEFVSVGGLIDGVTVEDIMLGLSVCRNPKLAAVFYRLDLIEAYGTGMQKIMKAYKDCGCQPTIEVTNNAFKITLPNRNVAAARGTASGSEQTILTYLQSHDYITRSEVDVLLGVSQATSSRILKRMLQEGRIIQEGSGRRTKYRLK